MDTSHPLDHVRSFIDSQFAPSRPAPSPNGQITKCVTISRQSGCGAHFFGEKLAEYLMRRHPERGRPWKVFDKGLVQAVLEDHHLPGHLARFMPEDRVSQLDEMVHNVFDLHPPTELLVRQTAETILRLAELGNVIIIGRGGNIVTRGLPGTLHVRLIGSLEARAGHIEHFDKLSRKDAMDRIHREEEGRERYLWKHFHKDVGDPLLYDLVINTDRVRLDDAAQLVGELAVKGGFVDKTKIPAVA